MNALEFNNETSLFKKGMQDKSPVPSTLEEVYHLIIGGFLHDSTEKFRYFESTGLKEDAKKEKKKAMCFTPSAFCQGGHGKKNAVRFTGRCMVDVDDQPKDKILSAMELLKNDPYVQLSYITLSGCGIRIIYQTDITDAAQHPYAYAQGNRYYASLLHFKADETCKDLTRCSAMCEDPNAYFNPDAEIMHIEIPSEEKMAKAKKAVGRPRKKHSAEAQQAESAVLNTLIQQNKEYTEGRYNEYVSTALYLMNDFGVPEDDARQWAINRFNDYNPSDVSSICHSAYLHTDEHGSRALPHSTHSSDKTGADSYYASVDELEAFIDTQAKIRINEINHRREICMKGKKDFRFLTDSDENTLWLRAKKAGLHTSNKIFTCILNSEYIANYHPFLIYAEKLAPWDGTTDYISQVADLVETHHPEYFRTIFKKWFVALVASLLNPDIVNHEILVFIGKEGIYKTTFFNKLLPPCLHHYFTAKIQTGSFKKDDLTEISECMLICIEEVDNMNSDRMNQIKASVSLPDVNLRVPYAHNREFRPHNSSFCATGNNLYYLSEGDNRRWLSEHVININGERLNSLPYEGMYAQAIALYHSGFRYWFNSEETKLVIAQNELFKEPNIEKELILQHYRIPRPGESSKLLSVTAIMIHIGLGVKIPLSNVKIRQALDKLGFQHKRNSQLRGYLVVELTREEIADRERFREKDFDNDNLKIPF